LQPIAPGEIVRMCLLGKATWSVGVCKALVGPRSYEIKVGRVIYRHNHCHLIRTNESLDMDDSNLDPQTSPEEDMDNGSSIPAEQDTTSPNTTATQDLPTLRKSQRNCRTPQWMEDYVCIF